VLVFLSDHPATPDRVSHVSAYITQQSLAGSDLGSERFAPVKAMVARGVASAPASAVRPPPPPPGPRAPPPPPAPTPAAPPPPPR
jgi:hypothetical protein